MLLHYFGFLAFGNAKTHIHSDASRFVRNSNVLMIVGYPIRKLFNYMFQIKHVDLELNFKGDILGATITGCKY